MSILGMADELEGASQRSASIRSVASKSSCASGVSLSRQARTRKRSRTVTGVSMCLESAPKSTGSELTTQAYPGGNFTLEQLPPFPSVHAVRGAPPRPQRSPRRDTCAVAKAVPDGNSLTAGVALRQDEKLSLSVETHHDVTKLTKQTSGMQILPTVSQPEPPLSAFSRDPEITGVDPAAVNLRDSVSTQLSKQSSIYPPSNSTTSEPDSPPSPRSVVHENDRNETSYDPVVNETQMYDGDDVSYRLQLLVNNNYFLPPAHSKPSAADFAAMEKTVQKKPSTPTFFERLRGKSKSKPTTPTGPSPGFDPAGPALRTPADSITSAHPLPRVSFQFQRGPPPETRTGRVVVVREKMEDVAIAAKQAEQEMKARALRRDQGSPDGRTTFPDVIDPTDVVDLPPPSSKYPFAVQASALCGLGVQESIGAAVLADHLPPPQSPGMSVSDRDDHWRKALLHEAVHHSLDNTPDTSFSMLQGTSTPLVSPLGERSQSSRAPLENHSTPLLDQRIINDSRLSSTQLAISRKKSSQSFTFASSRSRSSRRGSSKLLPNDVSSGVLPLRSATPSEPLTPLTPAPRKHVFNFTSQGEMEHHGQPVEGSSRATLRRAVSSPSLSEVYGPGARSFGQTPPPLPTPTQSFVSLNEKPNRITLQSFTTEHDHELVDGDSTPRKSFAMSAIEGRVSLSSEYSQPSPTMSAFRDAPQDMNGSTVNQARWQHSADHELISSNESSVARYSAMSPPPRISSSLAYFALSPPPRSSPPNYQIRSTPSPHVSEGSDNQQHSSASLPDDIPVTTNTPELTSPSFPLSQRRSHPMAMPLSLEIPTTNITVAIHSPVPSSPTSFFDAIQSQPSAMDDLESSSDESNEEADVTQIDVPDSNPYSHSISITPTTSRPSLMRLGNHSTPYVSHTSGEMRRPSTGIKDKKPIGNIPVRVPFFRDRAGKSDQGHGPPVSSFDFYKYTQQSDTALEGPRSAGIPGRRSTVGNVSAWKTLNPKAQESLKKLDGMLIQHMAAERDTIKRIAATARANSTIPVERGP